MWEYGHGHTTYIPTHHTISWEYVQKDHFVRILYDVIGTFIASWFSLCEAKNTVLDLETLKMSGSQTKCTSLFAHWISTHGPPPGPRAPLLPLLTLNHRGTRVFGPDAWMVTAWMRKVQTIYWVFCKETLVQKQILIRFLRYPASSCSKVSLAVRQIVAEAKQLKTRQSGQPSGALPVVAERTAGRPRIGAALHGVRALQAQLVVPGCSKTCSLQTHKLEVLLVLLLQSHC